MRHHNSSNLKYQTSNYFILLLMGLCVGIAGCARYEYDIVRPPESARHIGAKADEVFTRDPLEYRLITVDNRLVMRIFNMTDTIALNGPRSSVVDPDGQSRPLRTQTIAPHSFIKLIFPPLRPRIEHTGPSIGIGVGGVFGSARHRRAALGYGDAFYDDYYDEPRYFTVYDDDAYYWDWKGESQIRLMLVFERNEQPFEQEFVIAKTKM